MSVLQRTSRPVVWTIIALSLVGYLGNYFSLSLFFGVDFLFGSIAVLVAVRLLGPWCGLIVAIISGSYTYFLWHHPYAILLFAAEALCVGWLLRRVPELVLAEGLFWIFIGMPLVWVFYAGLLDVETSQTQLVMLKDAVNGIFNALIASLLLIYTPLRRLATGERRDAEVSLSQVVFNLLVGSVLFPTLLFSILDSRQSLQRIESEIQNDVQAESTVLVQNLEAWYQQHRQALLQVARVAQREGVQPSPLLQQSVQLVTNAYPDLHAMYVADAQARAVAFYPLRDKMGRSNLGVSFKDRAYYQELREALRPVVSNVFQGRAGYIGPMIAFNIPILNETAGGTSLQGYVNGALDLEYLEKLLRWNLYRRPLQATLLDNNNRVIATTLPNVQPMQQWRPPGIGEWHSVGSNLFQWMPQRANLPAMVRWRESIIFQRSSTGQLLPWTLWLQAPLAPYYGYLESVYLHNLFIMLAFSIAALIIASMLSRALAQPLTVLTRVTHDLPAKVLQGQNPDSIQWPSHSVGEIDTLVRNFQQMESTLRQNFKEIQSTQQALEIKRERLVQANRLKDEFLSVLSHELRTPLSPILGYAGLLAMGRLQGDDAVDAARSIERNARDQLRLIEDLLDVSRIIMGKLRVDVGSVQLHNVIVSAMETVDHSAKAKKIQLDFNDDGQVPPLLGDEARLRQVVWNLLSNAVKFTPENGRVEVRLECTNQYAQISVCDNGKGIEPEFLPFVFERFRQAEDYMTRSAGGLGLGLAIVRHLVELHGGTIEAHSAGEGQGSTFVVCLPLHVAPAERELAASSTLMEVSYKP
jgi:signal transduction histidine kinase